MASVSRAVLSHTGSHSRSEDNGTVLVIPLKGWGQTQGEDTTLAQREYRKSKTDVFREQRR